MTRTNSNDAYASNTAYAVNRNYIVNGLNQYTAAGGATFGYDANGNLTSDGSNTYVYDIENRLVTASGGHTATLRYDPLGRLYEVAGTSGATRFLYDGDALVAEYSSAGALTARYVHGSNAAADDPLIWYGGGVTHWLHADQQGSIVAITNGSGAVSSINAYDEWGIPNAGNAGRFQYTGQAWLAELGMYYYKARIYSPTLGRFLQTDPIGYEDQFNLYAYVGNDPMNSSDPTGDCAERTGPNGTTIQVGICGSTAEEQAYVDERIADHPKSATSEVERTAEEQGQYVRFGFGATNPQGDQVNGGDTLITEYSDGHRDITVTLDRDDAVTVGGVDEGTGHLQSHEQTLAEAFEHETGGHVGDALARLPVNEDRAIDRENTFIHHNGGHFRRLDHGGQVRSRHTRH